VLLLWQSTHKLHRKEWKGITALKLWRADLDQLSVQTKVQVFKSLVVLFHFSTTTVHFYLWVLHIYLTGSLWRRRWQQSFNMLTPFYFPFSLTACFGSYGPSSSEIYN
jgi:hypothetical protein